MPLDRTHWLREIATLDPDTDYEAIYRITSTHEFPWDMNQALGFALYRTYAIPSIGDLLGRTGEFTERTQKRYDDTGLILDAVLRHGLEDPAGRTGIRRMNQMHGHFAIPNEDLRYVLSTFVVVPIRWIGAYGYRPMTEAEKVASCNYYRRLGELMGIRDVPQTWPEFAEAMDAEESRRFGYDAGGRAVSDATLALAGTFPPTAWVPAPLFRRFARALMDAPLRDAFGYPHPSKLEERIFRGSLVARGRLLRLAPARRDPLSFAEQPQMRTYPDGHRVEDLGTFPAEHPGTRGMRHRDAPPHGGAVRR